MFNNKNNFNIEKLSKKIGYIFGYFLFTTILFFILNLLNKIPKTWDYFHIMGITLLIIIVGVLIKKILK